MSLFANSGELTKEGSGNATIGVRFGSNGTVAVNQRSLTFGDVDSDTYSLGVLKSGSWFVADGATLQLPGPVLALEGAKYCGPGSEGLQRVGKAGGGPTDSTLGITGDTTFTQPLDIESTGELVGDGKLTASELNVNGGFVGGNLTFDTPLDSVGGTLAAGQSPGVMIFNEPAMLTSTTIQVELAGVGLVDFDRYLFNAGVTFDGGTIVFDLIDGYLPGAGDQFAFLTASQITGFETLTFLAGDAPLGFAFDILNVPDANGVTLVLQVVEMPEPGAAALLTLGITGLLTRRRATK